MDLEILKAQFYQLVAPSLPNEWDVEEALAPLATDEAEHVDDIFAQIPAIWPVSHSLCFAYLSAAGPALCCLALDELSLWVHTLLDRYETGGLRGAQLFMDDVEQQFSRHLRGQGGLRLVDVRSRLQPYVNGLAGRELPLIAADAASTDSESIFLPSEIGLFSEHEENFLLYKLMVSFQWASLEAGTFAAPRSVSLHKKSAHPLDCFFSDFLHPANARSLYHFLETSRVLAFLRQELPGLMRDAATLLPKLPLSGDDSSSLNLLDRLQQGLLRGQWPVPGQSALDDRAVALLQRCQGQAEDNEVSLEAVRELMPLLAPEESLAQTNPLVFQGNLRLQEMRNLGMKQQTDKELRLMKTMTAKLPSVVHKVGGEDTPQNNAGGRQGQDAAVIIDMDRCLGTTPALLPVTVAAFRHQ